MPAQQRAFIILHECFHLTGLKDEILGASGDYKYTWEPGFSQLMSAEHAGNVDSLTLVVVALAATVAAS